MSDESKKKRFEYRKPSNVEMPGAPPFYTYCLQPYG